MIFGSIINPPRLRCKCWISCCDRGHPCRIFSLWRGAIEVVGTFIWSITTNIIGTVLNIWIFCIGTCDRLGHCCTCHCVIALILILTATETILLLTATFWRTVAIAWAWPGCPLERNRALSLAIGSIRFHIKPGRFHNSTVHVLSVLVR